MQNLNCSQILLVMVCEILITNRLKHFAPNNFLKNMMSIFLVQ